MNKQPWFRFYSEMLADRKIEYLCRQTGHPKALVIGIWSTILALANDSPQRGVLLLTEEIPLTIVDLARETGLNRETIENFVTELERLGMMKMHNFAYCLLNWDRRQFASDNSTDRVRAWRAQQKRNGDNTGECNDDNTDDGNVTETLQDCYSNTPETETEAETEAETEDSAAKTATPAKPPPKARRTRQKTSTPEAVKVFRANSARYPPKAWYDEIVAKVGDNPASLELWGKTVKSWVGKGWNPQNVEGMLEAYSNGGIKKRGPPGKTTNVDANIEAGKEWLKSKGL